MLKFEPKLLVSMDLFSCAISEHIKDLTANLLDKNLAPKRKYKKKNNSREKF